MMVSACTELQVLRGSHNSQIKLGNRKAHTLSLRQPHVPLSTSCKLQHRRKSHSLTPRASASNDDSTAAEIGPPCVIIECDGGLMDVHNDGHRVAFNKAFDDIGYSCVNWQPSIYSDLLRHGDGSGQGLIRTYYSIVGWPTMLPTKERPAFVQKVYEQKCKIFTDMVSTNSIPLRPYVAEFIDDLLADGAKPVVLTGTASDPTDSVVSSAMYNLGPSRASKIQVIALGPELNEENAEDDDPEDSIESLGEVDPTKGFVTLEQAMRVAKSKEKTKDATSFVRAMNLARKGVGMALDPALLAAASRAELISPQYLVAITLAMGCSARESALVAASHSLMETGKSAGLYVAGVPPSYAARFGYASMDASFDGFGAGALTWRKLKALLDKKKLG